MNSPTDINRLLDRMFVGEPVEPSQVADAAAMLRTDDASRDYYDGLARADAQLGGDFEARFGEAWFLDSLDEMLEEEAAEKVTRLSEVPVAANTNRPLGMILSSAALILVCFATVIGSQSQRDEFQARAAAAPPAHTYEQPEFGAFCVTRDGGDVTFRSAADFAFGTLRCPVDAELKLAARSQDARLRWGAFVGISADGRLHWYGPSPTAPAAVPIQVADTVRPIGETIRLEVNHRPGPVRLVGIFSETPLDRANLESIVRSNATRLRDGEVSVPNAIILRQTFEVTP